MKTIFVLFLAASAYAQTVVSGGQTIKGRADHSTASATLPHRSNTGTPVGRDACATLGETYFQTDATAGSNIFGCTTIGAAGVAVWTLQGPPSGGVTLTGDVTTVGSVATLTDAVVTPAKLTDAARLKTTCFVFGSDGATAPLTNADLNSRYQYFITTSVSFVEFTVTSDSGTPSIHPVLDFMGWNGSGYGPMQYDLLMGDLTLAAPGTGLGYASCASNPTGSAGIYTNTTCSGTSHPQSGVSPGFWIGFSGGVAGGTAKRLTACVTWKVN